MARSTTATPAAETPDVEALVAAAVAAALAAKDAEVEELKAKLTTRAARALPTFEAAREWTGSNTMVATYRVRGTGKAAKKQRGARMFGDEFVSAMDIVLGPDAKADYVDEIAKFFAPMSA